MRTAWRLLIATLLVGLVACRYKNLPPTAAIDGPTDVGVGDWVQLEGQSSSDPEGHALIYSWQFARLPQGSTTHFNDPQAENPSFLADVAGDYEVQLTVDDGLVDSDPVTHVVTATQGNRAPVADAGQDRAVPLNAPVTLDGTGSSDPDGDPITYSWRLIDQPNGAAAALDDPTSATPVFTPMQQGLYVWGLVVSDGQLQSAEARVTIAAGQADLPPVANAGIDTLATVGQPITLDGTGSSDPNGDALTYAWTLSERPLGSSAAFDDPTSPTPTFTPDFTGIYKAQLVVSDGTLQSPPDEVVITAVLVSGPPVANAGPDQNVATGDVVQLDGSGSTDPENDPLTYRWQLVSIPKDSHAQLNDSTVANPSFTADVQGTYIADLWVSDGLHEVGPDEVVVNATGVNHPPVADAGPDQPNVDIPSVRVGDIVQLDGSGSSDQDAGDLITYSWWFVQVPKGSQARLNIRTIVNPSFVADVEGDYLVDLQVSDGTLLSNIDQVKITASAGNAPPVASATADQTLVGTGAMVKLQSTSTDPDTGTFLTYNWWFVSKPAGSQATLSDPHVDDPWFVADVAGEYDIRLQVSDGQLLSNIAEVTVTAEDSLGDQPPVAYAGTDITDAVTGTPVTLDGTGSTDPDTPVDQLTYLWHFVSVPPGAATPSFNLATVDKPTFTPDVDGTWVIELAVSDGTFTSTDRVSVTSSGANKAPIACAYGPDTDTTAPGCQETAAAPQITVREGQIVQLDGSNSYDPDNKPQGSLNYHWSFEQLPSGFFGDFNYNDVVNPSFVAAAPGDVVVRLQVDDGVAVSNIDEVTVHINPAFKVIAFSPPADATGVSLDAPIEVDFNQHFVPTSVNVESLWINPGDAPDFATHIPVCPATGPQPVPCVEYDVTTDTTKAVLTVVPHLDALTRYTVNVTTAITSADTGESLNRDYASHFTTRAGTILLDTDPPDAATGVTPSTEICAYFTGDVNTGTVDDTTFKVTFADRWGEPQHAITWQLDQNTPTNTVCLIPQPEQYDCSGFDQPLLYDTTYTATITTGLRLVGTPGDHLADNYTWTFTTRSAPTVTGTDPVTGATDVPIVLNPLTVTLDHPVDPVTVDASTVTLEDVGGATQVSGTAQVGSDPDTIEFIPDAPLDYDTEYRLTVTSGLQGVLDTDGDWLMKDVVVDFTTSPANSFTMVPSEIAAAEQGDIIEILFSRPLDELSVNASTIQVLDTSTATPAPVNADFAYDAYARTVSIVTTPEVQNNHTYTITVTPGVLDSLENPYPADESVTFNVSGNANGGPGLSLGSTGNHGHDLYWVSGDKYLMITSVYASSLVFTDKNGNSVPYSIDHTVSTSGGGTVYIRPDNYLRSALSPYTLKATTNITDLARNAAQKAVTLTPIDIETTPPTVAGAQTCAAPAPGSQCVSADGATQVPGSMIATVAFSERMDETSIDDTTVRILDPLQNVVPSTVTVASDGLSATIAPTGFLAAGLQYTVDVTAGATDTAGNGAVPFQATFTVDDQAPTVTSVTPTDGSTGLSPSTDVLLNFSEPMDPSTFSESVVGSPGTVRLQEGGTEVYLCVDVSGALVTLDPAGPLLGGTTYDVSVDPGVTDAAGNALGTPFTSSFTTQ